MKYSKILQDYFEEEKDEHLDSHNLTKLEFLGNIIFDFTTYDSLMDEHFAKKMIEVLEVIVNKSNFEYIKDESNYLNYITMINMPFLVDKIEWGTSIRGAWLDEYPIHGNKDGYEISGELVIPPSEITIFVKELIEWSKGN